MRKIDPFDPGRPLKTVFLCGKISGDKWYKEKFACACTWLEGAGYVVMNPAVLPDHGFTHDQYLSVTLSMMCCCDAVCLLPDWKQSPGAKIETDVATREGIPGFCYAEWLEEYQRRSAVC